MKVLVIADSAFGNTWTLAGAIADAYGAGGRALHPEQAERRDLEGVDLLIVGSPTQGGRPLPSVTKFLRAFPTDGLKGIAVAAFDTRADVAHAGLPLRLLMSLIGFAAPKIGRELTAHGGYQVVPPEGFVVEGKEGPLEAGELERAVEWARNLQAIAPKR
jgi:flavodoxin